MKPLKAQVYESKRLTTPCFVQPKLNGVRALYQRGKFYSGDEIQWRDSVLAHLVTQLLQVLGDTTTILDGELYFHGWSLQRINGAVAVARSKPRADTTLICYHVFDVCQPGTSFADRFFPLYDALKQVQLPSIIPVRTELCFNDTMADNYFLMFTSDGYEGAMYRLGECPYTFPGQGSTKDNRVWTMLKRKAWRDADFLVVGVVEGLPTDKGGKFVGSLGSFELQTEAGLRFNASPAMSDAERLYYFLNPPIGKLAVVKYLNLSDDGIPLNPTVLSIREA